MSKNSENGRSSLGWTERIGFGAGFGPAKKAFAVPEELENKPKYENMFERRDI